MRQLPLTDLHREQFAILELLRHQPTLRYADLCNASHLESDSFKYHLHRLVDWGVIEKTHLGMYRLTDEGKNYGNDFDDLSRSKLRQPKQSLLLVVETTDAKGDRFVLMQLRKRQPFWGMWGLLSGPVRWGELPEETAARELYKQSGIATDFLVKGVYRQRGSVGDGAKVHEDNLFTILYANVRYIELPNEWYAGYNEWVQIDDVDGKRPHFPITKQVLEMLASGTSYAAGDVEYVASEY